jgi:hypothetical protein
VRVALVTAVRALLTRPALHSRGGTTISQPATPIDVLGWQEGHRITGGPFFLLTAPHSGVMAGIGATRRRHSVALNDRFPRLERPFVAAVAAFRFCAGFRIPAPLMIYPPVQRGRCPKAFREGTRGVWRVACRLWGFDGAAAWVQVALAGVVGSRSTIAMDNFSPPLPSSR